MIDTHVHYGMELFHEDLKMVETADRKAGITQTVCLPITYDDNFTMMSETADFANMFYAVGLHPNHVPFLDIPPADIGMSAELKKAIRTCRSRARSFQKAEEILSGFREQLSKLDQLIGEHAGRVVAIGETGIDIHTPEGKRNLQMQRISFLEHIRLSLRHDLPLVLHLRGDGALEEALNVMNNTHFGQIRYRGIWHCFHGTPEDMDRIEDGGKNDFLFGIGGIITYPERGRVLRETLRSLAGGRERDVLSKLVLETDAPFLVPQSILSVQGKVRNMSAFLPDVVEKLAEVLQVPAQEIMQRTSENACRMLGKR